MTQTLTVNTNWLNNDVPTVVNPANWTGTVKGYYIPISNNYYPYVTYWNYNYQPKIQLKLSEIEKLRKLAKDNPEIKEILNKFTTHIEVIVDF